MFLNAVGRYDPPANIRNGFAAVDPAPPTATFKAKTFRFTVPCRVIPSADLGLLELTVVVVL